MDIILASSSPYRRQLLARILSEFRCQSPAIDETSFAQEDPEQLALRLAREKARAVAQNNSNALVIASDQVAWHRGQQLTKPGNRDRNIEQLMQCQGEEVCFYTSIAVLNSRRNTLQTSVERYHTTFRHLSREQIENYVDREKPFDCAGGFKMEGLGIALFEKMSGDDPNTLIGLPLIRLIDMLHEEGIPVL